MTVADQIPLFMGFPRQEYWSEFPFPSAGNLSDQEIEFRSPALQGDVLPTEPPRYMLELRINKMQGSVVSLFIIRSHMIFVYTLLKQRTFLEIYFQYICMTITSKMQF